MPKRFSSLQEKRTYQSWSDMKSRCVNEGHAKYHICGGRGIKVCKRWRDSFEDFAKDMKLKPEGLVLGRTDKTKDFSPENCKWMTYAENNLNRFDSVKLTYKGKTQSIENWANELGMPRSTLSNRIHGYKWDAKTALTAPFQHKANIPNDPDKLKFVPKLNQKIANQIRDLYSNGWRFVDLAQKYEVSHTTITRILSGESYNK